MGCMSKNIDYVKFRRLNQHRRRKFCPPRPPHTAAATFPCPRPTHIPRAMRAGEQAATLPRAPQTHHPRAPTHNPTHHPRAPHAQPPRPPRPTPTPPAQTPRAPRIYGIYCAYAYSACILGYLGWKMGERGRRKNFCRHAKCYQRYGCIAVLRLHRVECCLWIFKPTAKIGERYEDERDFCRWGKEVWSMVPAPPAQHPRAPRAHHPRAPRATQRTAPAPPAPPAHTIPAHIGFVVIND